jgi:hypothetical protein
MQTPLSLPLQPSGVGRRIQLLQASLFASQRI